KQRPRGGYHPRGQFVQLKRWKSGGGLSGADFLLDAQRQRRQIGIVLLEQEGIEATAVLDGAQRRSRHAQLDRTVQRLGQQGHVEQVGEKAAAGTVERVGNVVSDHHALAGQFTATSHCRYPVCVKVLRG